MKNEPRAHGVALWNTGFSGLLCISLSFMMLEICIVQLRGKPVTHIISTLMATVIAARVVRLAILYRSPDTLSTGSEGQQNSRLSSIGVAVSVLLLAGTGYAGAAALRSGWATNCVIFVACLYLVPWSRISLCRRGFATPWCIVMLAASAALVVGGPLGHPVRLLVGAWILWMSATLTWMMLFLLRQRKQQPTRPGARIHAEASENVLPG